MFRLLPVLLAGAACSARDGDSAASPDVDADGYTREEGDCNDGDPDVHPDAVDSCDGLDNDCDGEIDEILPDTLWCRDVDGDGYGDVAHQTRTCFPETGWVQDCTDCDDAVSTVSPGETEACNGVDDDCDGSTDPANAVGSTTWYPDADGDGYGSAEEAVTGCEAPPGFVADRSDCDDSADDTNPSAPEICNDGRDNNCDDDTNGCVWEETVKLTTASAAFIAGPEADNEFLGLAVGFVDANGDGVYELAMSGLGAMYGDATGGDVHIWFGAPTGARSITDTPSHRFGPPSGYLGVAEWGSPVQVRDLDGDGSLEMLIAGGGTSDEYGAAGALLSVPTPFYDTGSPGPESVWARGAEAYEGFGAGFTLSESVAGEGRSVVVAAAPENSAVGRYNGAVYLVDIRRPDAADAVARVLGDAGDNLGFAVSGDHDLDGDGIDDLVLGTEWPDLPYVAVFSGPVLGEHTPADADFHLADVQLRGDPVEVAPDWDGDGVPELITTSSRGVHLIPGAASGDADLTAAAVVTVESGRVGVTSLGDSVAAGDFGRDGTFDLVIGAYDADAPDDLGAVQDGGAVAIIPYDQLRSGTNEVWSVATTVLYGPTEGEYAGGTLDIGDVNSDGFLDLILSSTGASPGGYHYSGGVWFLLGGGI